jgi:hypothetical protein
VAKFIGGPKSKLSGISTASALWAAAKQNIPIHLITPATLETTLPLLADGYDLEAIRDRVNSGRGVLIAQRPPIVDGHLVFGYAAIDMTTGDGAFLVNDARGGWLKAICPDTAKEFKDCSPWLVNFVDLLLIVSVVTLITAGIILGAAVLLEGTLVLAELIPNLLYYYLVLGASPAAISLVFTLNTCAEVLAGNTGRILNCLKDIFRFFYTLRTGELPAF